MSKRVAIIAGAGPAGLTAALELLEKTDVKPIVYEADTIVGGLARTVNYKGNRIDIGGHRFFSKSTRVMDWWVSILPLQRLDDADEQAGALLSGSASAAKAAKGPDPAKTELVMLLRQRRSRILYLRRFFDYPVSLNAQTVRNLGARRMVRIGLSYIKARIFPIRNEYSLEDFMVNRFGRELYATFFRDYTEKVWGVPASEIKADWGAQRIKGLSISKAIGHALKGLVPSRKRGDIYQREVETSLIERFLYPKRGPGQLWEEVTRRIEELGGEVILQTKLTALHAEGDRIVAASVQGPDGKVKRVKGDYFFSTIPLRELVGGLEAKVPKEVADVAKGLVYRDFITVGVLLKKFKASVAEGMTDNWIYVQEPDVKVGRLQIFNNWSPYLVADPDTVWVGMEYFADEGDALWSMGDAELSAFAVDELCQLDLVERADVLDTVVLRVPKAYPAYFGSYDNFAAIRTYLDKFANLFVVGRNGMHRYNNQDHSMLTAMVAVENIAAGVDSKDNIWSVNVEQEYHESKGPEESDAPASTAASS
jgi:protoporphyrinogen oxidase